MVTPETSVVATARQLSTQLGDEVVILGLHDSVYYGLANVGARIWELLQTPHTFAEIVSAVVSEYDAPAERVEADLRTLLSDLHARGLVDLTNPDRA